jgi:hypothetical protein
MAVAFGAAGVGYPASPFNVGAGGSYLVPYPAGIVAGSSLLLCVANVAGKALTTPTGWVAQKSSIAAAIGISVLSKVATGSETGSLTVAVAAGQTAVGNGIILRYGGADTTTPFGASVVATGTSGLASPTPGVLTPGANDMVVRFYAWGQTVGAAGATLTLSATGGFNSRYNHANQSSAIQPGIVAADLIAGTANDVVTASAAGSWAVVDIIIQAPSTYTPGQFMPFFT